MMNWMGVVVEQVLAVGQAQVQQQVVPGLVPVVVRVQPSLPQQLYARALPPV
jgi:hypothetical protein